MPKKDVLDKILGDNLTESEIAKTFLLSERRILDKLVSDFSLDKEFQGEIVRGLYRFRQICGHYIDLYFVANNLFPSQRAIATKVFSQMSNNLNRDSRSCFSKENFFGKIRFMLEACDKLDVSWPRRKTYLKWILNFPITLEDSIEKVLEHELYPNNLPHIYMHMTAGFVRRRLVDKQTGKKISGQYRTFLKELNAGKAHTRWFNTRYAGSYGSRQ